MVLLLFKFKTTFDGKVWKLITSQHLSIWSLSHMLKIAHETCINNYLLVPDALILAGALPIHTPFSAYTSSECSGDAAHKLMRACSLADQIFNIHIKI